MTRSQLIAAVARQTGEDSRTVEKIFDNIFDSIAQELQTGSKVTIAGFGRFEMRARKTKAFTNPKTGAVSLLQPSATPGFRASHLLKEKLT